MISERTSRVSSSLRRIREFPRESRNLVRNGGGTTRLRLYRIAATERLRRGVESLIGARNAPAPTDKKKSKVNYGMKFYRDAENEMKHPIKTATDLYKKLGVEDKSKAPELRALVNRLAQDGNQNEVMLSYLSRIGGRHGLERLEKISRSLKDFSGSCQDKDLRKTIQEDCLHDIAYPSDINQRGRDTCGPAAAQMMLALHRPEEYTRILTNLALGRSPRLKGGRSVRPNSINLNNADDNRSVSCKIVQDAFSKFMGCSHVDQGTSTIGMQPLMRQLYGTSKMQADTFLGHSGENMWKYMEDDIAQGWPVIVGFRKHWVLATGIDKSGDKPKVILNTWGKQNTLDQEEFYRQTYAVIDYDDTGRDRRETPSGQRTVVNPAAR